MVIKEIFYFQRLWGCRSPSENHRRWRDQLGRGCKCFRWSRYTVNCPLLICSFNLSVQLFCLSNCCLHLTKMSLQMFSLAMIHSELFLLICSINLSVQLLCLSNCCLFIWLRWACKCFYWSRYPVNCLSNCCLFIQLGRARKHLLLARYVLGKLFFVDLFIYWLMFEIWTFETQAHTKFTYLYKKSRLFRFLDAHSTSFSFSGCSYLTTRQFKGFLTPLLPPLVEWNHLWMLPYP